MPYLGESIRKDLVTHDSALEGQLYVLETRISVLVGRIPEPVQPPSADEGV